MKTYEIKTLNGWKKVGHQEYWERITTIVNKSPMCANVNDAIKLITEYTRVNLTDALPSWNQENWAALMYEWAKN